MERFDVVVLGQGIAGTVLAWQLRRARLRTMVIDRDEAVTSSKVAAGLITPVTGKRLAKSWRWDELIPVAIAFYRSVEAETGKAFFHQKPSVRLFKSERERDECRDRVRALLAGLIQDTQVDVDAFDAPHGAIEMAASARLDVPRFLHVSRDAFLRDGGYASANIDLARDVELMPTGVRLARLGIESAVLAICRGYSTEPDPWFGGIRFNAAKGEILTVRIPGLTETRVIHRGVWLAPTGDGLFRVGSTYVWDVLNVDPTEQARAELESRLQAYLRRPYAVVDHQAAVRPVIDAGFPVLGRHPRFPQLAWFNGLGSKGSLLAPFFAEQLAANLERGSAIERNLDVRKFL